MNGIFVASATPFDNEDKFHPQTLLRLMERNLAEGAAGFFIGGSSAECFLLTESERVAVFETAATLRSRTSLIAHVGAVSTGEAVRYAIAAKQLGFHYVAATPPFYYGFTAAQIARYYRDIAEAAGMPVMIYNFPGNTGKPFNLADPVIRELLRSDTIFGVKHTNLDLYQMERIRSLNPKLVMMNGFDETMVGGLALGADGSIGSTFNIMLPHYKRIYDTCLAGGREEALALQEKANNIMEALCGVGLIPAIKYVLRTQGIDAGAPRRPFMPLALEQERYIDGVLQANLVQ